MSWGVVAASGLLGCGAEEGQLAGEGGSAGVGGTGGTSVKCTPPEVDCGGACVLTATDVKHCGACQHGCSSDHGSPACNGGLCSIECTTGYLDCDGNAETGCETNTQNSVQNCGACGKACNSINGTPTCNSGACAITCSQGFKDCDGKNDNGCEIDLDKDPKNCGSCGHACDSTHGAPACVNGSCSTACAAGFGDCDGNPDNGCETTTQTSLEHCGGCGHACSTMHGAPSCVNGSCSIQCESGFGDCDGNPDNGCESDFKTSGQHCKSCGHDCLGGECVAGACQPVVLASGQTSPGLQTQDSTHLYWNNLGSQGSSNGAVMKIPIAGGTPTTLASGLDWPLGLAVDATSAYYTTTPALWQVPLSGGASVQLATSSNNQNVAVNSTHVFWVAYLDHSIHKLKKGSNTKETVVSGIPEPCYVLTNATHVFWINQGSPSPCNGTIGRIPLNGGTSTTIASDQCWPNEGFLDGDTLYWNNRSNGTIMKVPASGGTAATVASDQGTPTRPFVDATHVYWGRKDGHVMRVSKAGGPIESIAEGQAQAWVLVSDCCIFWSSRENGTIVKLAK